VKGRGTGLIEQRGRQTEEEKGTDRESKQGRREKDGEE